MRAIALIWTAAGSCVGDAGSNGRQQVLEELHGRPWQDDGLVEDDGRVERGGERGDGLECVVGDLVCEPDAPP